MGVAKVDYFGQTLIDLTNDTITPETLLKGITAHDANGDAIVGTLIGGGGSSDWLYEVGEFSTTEATHTVTHHLGKIPDIIIIQLAVAMEQVDTGFNQRLICGFAMSNNVISSADVDTNSTDNRLCKGFMFFYKAPYGQITVSTFSIGLDEYTSDYNMYSTNNSIKFGTTAVLLQPNVKYIWYAYSKK